MNYARIKRWIDLFFYIIFLPIIITLVPMDRWLSKYPEFAIILILFLYALYFSIQKINLPKKFLERRFFLILAFCVIVVLMTILMSHFPYPPDALASFDKPERYIHFRALAVWFMTLVVTGYGLSVSILDELLRQVMIKKNLEEKKKNAELALYKAQINPHFFFNTMNTLYGLVISKSDNAEEAFVKFTELIKFSYSRIDKDLIPITDEIDYLRNYIDLQKLRLNRHTEIRRSFEIDDNSLQIPPMLLISFVENAFKYGTSSTHDSFILIHVKTQNKKLTFQCVNDIMRRSENSEFESVGIENTVARLEMLYPHKYDLEAREHDGRFIVKLNLDLL